MENVQEKQRCGPPGFQSGTAVYGCSRAQELADEVLRLQVQVRLQRQRGDRYMARHDELARELSAERVKTMRLAGLKRSRDAAGEEFVSAADVLAVIGAVVDGPAL